MCRGLGARPPREMVWDVVLCLNPKPLTLSLNPLLRGVESLQVGAQQIRVQDFMTFTIFCRVSGLEPSGSGSDPKP